MERGLRELVSDEWPQLLHHIPDPPKQLYIRGCLPPESSPLLTVVGSRQYTPYGRDACQMLIENLRGHAVSIVSGLALGIDGIAHEAALQAGLHCTAIPGSGLDDSVLYPASHKRLAWRILKAGGCLVSEFEPLFKAQSWSFVRRNRLMAGMSTATLIIEAAEKSGTMVTARLALEYNRDVFAVPGPITSSNSFGTNMLIQEGAVVILRAQDIIDVLHLERLEQTLQNLSPTPSLSANEAKILALVRKGPVRKDALLYTLSLPSSELNVMLTMLEIKKLIRIEDEYVSALS